jgi:hypothetical protein
MEQGAGSKEYRVLYEINISDKINWFIGVLVCVGIGFEVLPIVNRQL